MMREYRFRGRRADNGAWVYGSLVQHLDDGIAYIVGKHDAVGANGGVIPDQDYKYEVDTETVGQWTGLNDNNREHIYEGDICKSFGFDGVPIPKLHTVIWHDQSKNVGTGFNIHDDGRWFEVIGNIHDDNIETLEKMI